LPVSPVDELPVGTVTFLFTDIEGSTRLLKQLRERYGEALEEHQRILRETFTAHDGREIDTQGDSFFVAFRRAKDAVAAAVDGQRRLAGHEWPEGAELRVRMGLHTGEPAAAGERYVGLGVHRAARISAAGHGGQVLVSQATRELLRDDPLPEVSLRDLGEHQLKDLDEPERLFQLVAPGLEGGFPRLKTAAPAPFEGREAELAEATVEQMATRRPGRRTLIAATFGAAVIGVVAGVLLTQGGGSTASASVEPDSVGVINQRSGEVVSTFSAGGSPGGVAVGEGATWVTNPDANTVARINAGSDAPNQTYQVGGGPVGVAVGHGSVWVANGLDGTVSRIDPASPLPAQTIHVGNGPIGIAYGSGRVWVANSVDGTVSEITPGSRKPPRTLAAVPGATGVVLAFQRVWVVSPSTGAVVSLDPGSGKIEDTVHVGVDPVAIAAGDDAIWVANRDNGNVTKIAPRSPTQAYASDEVTVGRGPISIATVPGAVWVANGAAGTLSRIDPATDDVVKTISFANPPQALDGTAAGIYVAVRSSGAEHRGGTLRVRETAPDFVDPALAYSPWSWGILSMTNDGLVGFRRVGGIEGVQLVPDLAVSLPAPTDAGRTYTFRLRTGIRYSTGKPVQPADFRTAIERILESKLQATGSYFLDIVGAHRCKPGRHCDLSRGIVGEGRTVTFHLTKPDGDFLSKLALISAAAVPAGTPPPSPGHARYAPPATGPYMIASYRKGRSLTLVRNPHFRQWSADAQPAGYPNRITFSFLSNGAGSESAIDAVKAGKADIAPAAVALSKAQLEALRTGYPSQLRLRPGLSTDFFFLNTSLPPFDDVRVRRAVNDAFDRQAYEALQGPGYAPTCQVLPPDYPSYRRTCLYKSGGPAEVAAARRVVRGAGLTGASVTVWMPSAGVPQGRYMVRLLDSIGLRAHLKVVSIASGIGDYFDSILNPNARPQIGYFGWIADYPSVTGFLPPMLSCASHNVSRFCDPAIDRLFAKAETAQAENPAAAPALWQQAERAVLLQAPLVPEDNPQNVAFLAKHVDNFQYHPEWGVLLDQLWLK
jgi:ABC-type transport system substrate-binding protein/class 3 adenylate cyclase